MVKKYKLDHEAVRICECLTRDFRSVEGQEFCPQIDLLLEGRIREFREAVWPTLGEVDPMRFKRLVQLRDLFKRHTFESDAVSPEEREVKSKTSFLEFQETLLKRPPWTLRSRMVLGEARRICRQILGDNYDPAGLNLGVKPGRRATLGNPLHKAFLDVKFSDPAAFTCPSKLRSWWLNHYCNHDDVFRSITRKAFRTAATTGRKLDLHCDYLNLVVVPKIWKTGRIVMPLSLIGLFYSYDIGEYVTGRLRDYGLDLSRLQQYHRMLAKSGSVSRHIVTADMSRASDSLYPALLNAVLPRALYRGLKPCMTHKLKIGNSSYYSETVLSMGNGATFPVETLVFYCLIKAVGNLLKVRGKFSVYGDDLIYPRRIHSYVLQIFDDLGLKVNAEKTYAKAYFRESCGGDFYHGMDVRPTMLPEVEHQFVDRFELGAWLYNVTNHLLEHWKPCDLSSTMHYLMRRISTVMGKIFVVPPSFSDEAGLKIDPSLACEWWIPWQPPKIRWSKDYQRAFLTFRALVRSPDRRRVAYELPYYWDTLRSNFHRREKWRFWESWIETWPQYEVPRKQKGHKEILGCRELRVPDHTRIRLLSQIMSVETWA